MDLPAPGEATCSAPGDMRTCMVYLPQSVYGGPMTGGAMLVITCVGIVVVGVRQCRTEGHENVADQEQDTEETGSVIKHNRLVWGQHGNL